MNPGNTAERVLLAALLPDEDRAAWLSDANPGGPGRAAIERLEKGLADAGLRPDASESTMDTLAAHRSGLLPAERPAFDRRVEQLATTLPDAGDVLARWRERCERMAALDASLPAEAHFERLSGRSASPGRTAEPARVHRLWPVRWWAAAAVVVTLGAAGAIGRVSEDEDARAAWRSVEARIDMRTRGPQAASDFGSWTQRALGSRSLRLGLWPVYDRDALDALERDVLESEDGSPESLLLLGELRLMRGEREAGLVALRAAAGAGNEQARVLLGRVE